MHAQLHYYKVLRRAEVFDKVLSKLSLKIYDLYMTNWKMTIVIWIAVGLDILLVFWAAKTQYRMSSHDCTGCGDCYNGDSEPFLTFSISATNRPMKSLTGDIDFKTTAHYEDVADPIIKMKAPR